MTWATSLNSVGPKGSKSIGHGVARCLHGVARSGTHGLIRSEQHIWCTHIEKAPIHARHGIINVSTLRVTPRKHCETCIPNLCDKAVGPTWLAPRRPWGREPVCNKDLMRPSRSKVPLLQSSQPEQLQGHPDRIASMGAKDGTDYNHCRH